MSLNTHDCPHNSKLIEHEYRIAGLEKESVSTKTAVEGLKETLTKLTANLNQIKWLIAGGILASLGGAEFSHKLLALLM